MELVQNPDLWEKFLGKSGFILEHCVGNGSFGDVFAVTKATTGEVKAMKRLVARRKISEDVYVMAEIEALMELRHPNIVTLEEVMLCKRMICLVMELAPIGNLEQLLLGQSQLQNRDNSEIIQPQQHSIEATDHFRYTCFRQVASAVCHCHSQDLAHRDINPSNVLIFHESLVKLADFNLCFRCSDVTSGEPLLCEDYLGQDTYLAPEVKCHRPFSAKPADIWSLGCLLYFLAHGEHAPGDEERFLKKLKSGVIFSIGDRTDQNKNMISDSLKTLSHGLIKQQCSIKSENRPCVEDVLKSWKLTSKYVSDLNTIT